MKKPCSYRAFFYLKDSLIVTIQIITSCPTLLMKNIDKLLLSHIFIACIFISVFIISFSKTFNILILHLVLISSLYTLIFYISRLWQKKFKHFATILFTLASTFLIFVYSSNFLSNAYWNNNVSFGFILTYISDLDKVLEEVPFGIESLIILFILVLLLIYTLYWKYATYLHDYDHNLKFKDTKTYLFVAVFTSIYASLSFAQTDPGLWDGEPLSNLLLKSNTQAYYNDSNSKINFNDTDSVKVNPDLQNIILIHADALRADHMSSYGYHRDTTPYISSLIDDDAIQIETGLSVCSESICGMLAALGSRMPEAINAETPLIHSYLKAAGYRTIFAGSGNFSWENLTAILSHDIDYFARADLDKNYTIHDDGIILSSLSQMPNYDGTPSFFFLRYLSPHPIGRHFSQYREYTPSEKNLLGYIFPSLHDSDIQINAYDNGIVQLDDLIKQAITVLEKKGYMDNSLLVIFGDHGEAFNEHGYYGHYQSLQQEEIHVPIIFISSKKMQMKDIAFATLNDILPTILDINQLPIPTDIDGISLLKNTPNRVTFHSSRTGTYGVVDRTEEKLYKLIYNSKSSQQQLFELKSDPLEKNNLTEDQPDKTKQLLNRLKKHFELI